eukprot:TRINITY_DN6250_c0_g1_i1.p1 TRINITY_DN6250_c0_g1~~TRINITY_DN6250_c0_g1_i1.p1  ORF type:complete len:432 (-),score=115.70 TRINITY_DN6250_c0_g1_i1:37-1200(-)
MEVHMANMKKYIDPHGKHREVDAGVAAAKSAFGDLEATLRSGNMDESALREALGEGSNVVEKLKELRQKETDEVKIQQLDETIASLENLMKRITRTNDKGSQKLAVNDILYFLDDVLETINADQDDNIIKSGATASNYLAKLGTVNVDSMNLFSLMNCASDLSSQLRDMASSTSGIARNIAAQGNLTEVAQSAASLDELIRNLDAGILDFEPLELPKEAIPESTFTPPRPIVENPQTFEDTVDKVAYDIHQKAEAVGGGYCEGISVWNDGFQVAGWEVRGDRKRRGGASKAIDAHVKSFCLKLQHLEKKIPGANTQQKREKERLQRCMQALSNYGMQLKILTSVKAASIDSDKDTDESLSSLTTSMGNLFNEALTAIDIVNKTGMTK